MTLAVSSAARIDDVDLASRSINTLRFLAVDAIQKSNSGHPGMPMGAAAMGYVVWRYQMKQDPASPDWPNRDRFVLSAGHGSMLLYGLLHLAGYPLTIGDIRDFRQWESATPGHPEYGHTPGVETTTGPLGQGFANGVGMALAESIMAARFNRPGFDIVDHHTFGIVSDGDLMEGISHEAASLAGHLGLGKLIYLYDDNRITIDGSTDITFTEDIRGRFEAYDWQVLRVQDGNDVREIDRAIQDAKSDSAHPSLIMVRTHIGFGSPNKQDTSSAHGAPLGDDEIRLTKQALGWPESPTFHVPDDVLSHMNQIGVTGAGVRRDWEAMMIRYQETFPEASAEWDHWVSGTLPDDWDADLPSFEAGSAIATRAASGKVINAVAPVVSNLMGGSADLAGSNNTYIAGKGDYQKDLASGGNLHFGIREHAMGAICNGMILHGGIRPYCATFLVFSDYMRGAIRLSALMGLAVTYVFTHDSIGVGEDGPTHQPIEHVMSLRAIPNTLVIRPSDGNETVEAWKVALQHGDSPVILALTRQKLNNIDRAVYGAADGLARGAYVLKESSGPTDVILIATGSEVDVAMGASEMLEQQNIGTRVVSMPCWELFEMQDDAYRESVLPADIVARVSIEAGITTGWEKYVGLRGCTIGIDRFGASAPASVLFEKFGLTVAHVVAEAKAVLQ